MKRRDNRYDRIKQRLDDWGAYARDEAELVGWNVHTLDFDAEVPRGYQKRNDVTSNPTALEVQRMDAYRKRNMQTQTALNELRPKAIRDLIKTKHRDWPDASDTELARKTQWQQRHIGRDLRLGYDALIEILDGLQHQRFNDHQSVASYGKTVALSD